jgi:glycosyltransferase involved in cell wall biosynthesis
MEWKGQRAAIEAMDRVEARHPGAGHLVLQGDAFGPRDAEYAAMLEAEATRRPYVTLRPGAPEMGPSYAASDVVLVPSTSPDPFPTVVLEAGAAGRPTVVTDRGGGREAVVDGVTGIVSSPTAASLSEAMVRLLDPSVRQAMGDAAHQHVTTELGVARYCAQIDQLWDEVAGG